MKPAYILLLFCIVYPILDGLFNGYFKRKNTANHWLNSTQVIMKSFLIGFFCFNDLVLMAPEDKFWETIQVAYVVAGFRLIFFDPSFNIMAKRPLFSYGTTYVVDKYFPRLLKWIWKWFIGSTSVVLMLQWLIR